MSDRPAMLLYDGTCGFCSQSVQFVLRHERRDRTLRFASLQSETGEEVRRNHPEIATIDSLLWYEPDASGGTLLCKSRAVLRVLRYLGGPWRGLGAVAAIVPRPLLDVGYDFIARHRHQLVRGAPACLLPSPEQRPRFLG
ncbi:MAG TPA: DCC1-like thiol-disulfide oxidoreductase family protein [Thermoanaerobaculia bacterium]